MLDKDDLNFVVRVIDACSERGAFKGEELFNVGKIRQKIISETENDKTETPTLLVEDTDNDSF